MVLILSMSQYILVLQHYFSIIIYEQGHWVCLLCGGREQLPNRMGYVLNLHFFIIDVASFLCLHVYQHELGVLQVICGIDHYCTQCMQCARRAASRSHDAVSHPLGPHTHAHCGVSHPAPFLYLFQSQKPCSRGSFSQSRLEVKVSAGSINQASAKFKKSIDALNYSSAHHNIIILSIEDRVHYWLKPPHKCTQTTLTCSLHPYISTITIFGFFFFKRPTSLVPRPHPKKEGDFGRKARFLDYVTYRALEFRNAIKFTASMLHSQLCSAME